MSNTDKKSIKALSDQLYKASKSIRVLTAINWNVKVKEAFFKSKAQKLPKVSYPKFDANPALVEIKNARKLIPSGSSFENWGTRIADNLENSAMLLATLGSPDFFLFSKILYGSPEKLLPDGETTTLDLANHFERMYDNIDRLGIEPDNIPEFSAQELVDKMTEPVLKMFGKNAPKILLSKSVSSKVIAGRTKITVRSTATFSDRDISQLLNHEAYIHVATAINGHAQTNLRILSAAYPGTTKMQEGLAVFAEFISGNIDLDRLRRLSDRVVAIQMAIDGADFIEVYRYYETRSVNIDQAFENTRRVFRGGVITGKAPFTKDIVYLEGLLKVHNFLRVVVSAGRADVLPLLFVGKLDLQDIGDMIAFKKLGLLKDPKYLPPWMTDIRFLVTYLSYSSFLNSVKLDKLRGLYEGMIQE
ncbi:MAG: hypothetical protein ACI8P3_003081 [Saprospiraceae bacterium]|jgi:uncharacterized protein (TIGR02421 family)